MKMIQMPLASGSVHKPPEDSRTARERTCTAHAVTVMSLVTLVASLEASRCRQSLERAAQCSAPGSSCLAQFPQASQGKAQVPELKGEKTPRLATAEVQEGQVLNSYRLRQAAAARRSEPHLG